MLRSLGSLQFAESRADFLELQNEPQPIFACHYLRIGSHV
jgi:hypothetical protein